MQSFRRLRHCSVVVQEGKLLCSLIVNSMADLLKGVQVADGLEFHLCSPSSSAAVESFCPFPQPHHVNTCHTGEEAYTVSFCICFPTTSHVAFFPIYVWTDPRLWWVHLCLFHMTILCMWCAFKKAVLWILKTWSFPQLVRDSMFLSHCAGWSCWVETMAQFLKRSSAVYWGVNLRYSVSSAHWIQST